MLDDWETKDDLEPDARKPRTRACACAQVQEKIHPIIKCVRVCVCVQVQKKISERGIMCV